MSTDQTELPFLTDGGTETSRLAGESIREHVGRLEGMVLDVIRSRGTRGATCYEVEVALGMSHQTTSARCTGLKRRKMVYPSGQRRPTGSGRMANVLVAATP